MSVYVIGHRPPPVTGENLCRAYLVLTLKFLGYKVRENARSSLRNLCLFRSQIWLMAGASRVGHFRDFTFLVWWLLLGCRVHVYIHNISWRYFRSSACVWRLLGRQRLVFVVLTDSIKAELTRVGLTTVRLNNTLAEGGEPSATIRSFERRLLWLGGVTEEKGFSTAYAAFTTLHEINPEWRFDVFGSGPLSGDSAQFPLATWHGFVSGEGKQSALTAGGILILPSRYVNETQPLALIEALANGLPFLASNIGGLSVMAGPADDPSGICLPPDAPNTSWVAAVQQIERDYTRFSASACRVYSGQFSRKAYQENLSALIASIYT
jgi:glycosyltransferase involved in cell wall biosynthesis